MDRTSKWQSLQCGSSSRAHGDHTRLEELKKEGHARFDLDIGKGEVITALPVPERFLPYEIMDREAEEYSQARKRRYEERKAEEKEKILGGELSVRDIVVPDFGACVEILD